MKKWSFYHGFSGASDGKLHLDKVFCVNCPHGKAHEVLAGILQQDFGSV
jgi:hypothetical protein